MKTPLRSLITGTEPTCSRYACKRMGGSVDAQALVQETLLKVMQHLGELQQQGKFASWMFGIASQLCAGIDRECQKQIECILLSAVSCEGKSFEVAVAIEHG
jgi:DNA-directed RNA polymerase specialized sigma24 family protein